MRIIIGIFVWCAVVLSSGCAVLDAEKNNRGGFLDEVADDLWMKADSKKMRALRAITLEASLARIAMVAPKSAPDRSLLARRIGETTRRAEVVRQCAFSQLTVSGRRSDEPCFFFDSVMVDYENALFDLAIIALPIDDAKKLMTRVTGGIAAISVNPLELVQALLDIGREAFRYGRVVGAIYRDTLELEVQVWLASPAFSGTELARGVPEEFVVTDEKVAGLRAAYVRGNDNIPAWRGAILALRAQGLEPVPDQRFITELYAIVRYICGQIISETDPAFKDCAQSDLIKNIPVATGPSGNVFGPGPSTTGPKPTKPANTSPKTSLPVLTCPPTQGKFDTADANATKLNEYLRTGPEAERPTRIKNLEDMFQLPNVRSKLVPGRTPRLVTVLNMVECKDVRDLMAAEAVTKGFIK